MIDPGTIAASAIVKLAYEGLVKGGAEEFGKRAIQGTANLTKGLWQRIKAQFKGNQRAESAIADLESSGSDAALAKVEKYVDLELEEDPAFATEIRQMAHQIINIQNQNTIEDSRRVINTGRDYFEINNPSGDLKLGGS